MTVRAVILLLSFALSSFAQQSNPPQERVRRSTPSTTPSSQTPSAQPPQQHSTPATPGAESRRESQRAMPEQSPVVGPGQSESAGARFDMTEHAPVQTHHTITAGGKTIHYTATAGRLPIKDATGKIEAEMFFVAYTQD